MKPGSQQGVSFAFETSTHLITNERAQRDSSRQSNKLDESLETINRLSSNRMSTQLEQIRRVIVLGDSKVGKTSIVRRIVDDLFNKDYDNTVNYDIVRHPYHLTVGSTLRSCSCVIAS